MQNRTHNSCYIFRRFWAPCPSFPTSPKITKLNQNHHLSPLTPTHLLIYANADVRLL